MDPDYELFVRIAELGSVSAAGRALGMSAPTASKRLARLEERLGTRLINRTTRRNSMTSAGQSFREDLVGVLNALNAAEARLAGDTVGLAGPLTISAPTSFGRLHIAPHLKTFLAAYPFIELELDLSDEYSDLITGGPDLAVRITKSIPKSLLAHKLAPNRRVLCAAPSYLAERGVPSSLRDLQNHALLAANGQSPWRISAQSGNATVDAKSVVRTNSSEVVRELVLAGVGIALRSIWDVGGDITSGRLIRVLDGYEGAADFNIVIVHPRTPIVPGRVAAFIDFLRNLYLPTPPWEARVSGQSGEKA